MYLQEVIEAFDTKALNIKEWGTGISVGVAAFALKASHRWLFGLVAINALCFWIIEASWKLYQWAYMQRIVEIESYFRSVNKDKVITPFQITQSWYSEGTVDGVFKSVRSEGGPICGFFVKFFDINVMLPYLVIIIVAGLLCWFWKRFEIEVPGSSV